MISRQKVLHIGFRALKLRRSSAGAEYRETLCFKNIHDAFCKRFFGAYDGKGYVVIFGKERKFIKIF